MLATVMCFEYRYSPSKVDWHDSSVINWWVSKATGAKIKHWNLLAFSFQKEISRHWGLANHGDESLQHGMV